MTYNATLDIINAYKNSQFPSELSIKKKNIEDVFKFIERYNGKNTSVVETIKKIIQNKNKIKSVCLYIINYGELSASVDYVVIYNNGSFDKIPYLRS